MPNNEIMRFPNNELTEGSGGENKEVKKLGYSIRKEGGLSYIVDSNGNKVSNAYHEFKTFKQQLSQGEASVFIGRLGAMEVMLKVPEQEGQHFEEVGDKFHSIEINEELGLILNKVGAMKRIVDPNTGRVASKGYHEFFRRSGKLYGRTGDHEELVEMEEAQPSQLDRPNNKLLE